MRRLVWIWTLVFFVHSLPGVGQVKRICVMGSSSAYGYFPGTSIPRDSAWAFKVKKHFKDLGIIDTLYNIGTPGIDCYIGMPTGYVPPAGRNLPNPEFNITRAVNFDPRPDVIIVNFPSNNYTVLSIPEIIFCLQTMKDYANARGIRCYITTTQPRNDFVQPSERQKLKDIKNQIEATFGVFSIDFYSDIVEEPSLFLRPEYNLGDGVHLTPEGHTLLKNKVVARDIFFGPVALDEGTLKAVDKGSHVLINWYPGDLTSSAPYRLERAVENGPFELIKSFDDELPPSSAFLYADAEAAQGTNFYRVKRTAANGTVSYSEVVPVNFSRISSSMPYLFPAVTSSSFTLLVPPSTKPVLAVLFDMAGRMIWNQKFAPSRTWRDTWVEVSHLPAGTYRLCFPHTRFPALGLVKQ